MASRHIDKMYLIQNGETYEISTKITPTNIKIVSIVDQLPSINARHADTVYIKNVSEPISENWVTISFFKEDGVTPENADIIPKYTVSGAPLEYSHDTVEWIEFNSGTLLTSINTVLYLRGIGRNSLFIEDGEDGNNAWTTSANKMNIYGDLNFLLDYQTPPQVLGDYCYSGMFYNCVALQQVPFLPASTLGNYVYSYMFYGCESLSSPPILLATEVSDYCYESMFQGCILLQQAPDLIAEVLADGCYTNMFAECNLLSGITANFTSWEDGATSNWLPAIGSINRTITKPTALPNTRGTNYIPNGWTIIDF